MGKTNPDMTMDGTMMNTAMKLACSCVFDSVDMRAPSASSERMNNTANAPTGSTAEALTGSWKTSRANDVTTTKSSAAMTPYGIIFPAINAEREMGVTNSCSMVPCSFSRTSPADSTSTTTMITMPMVPGRKKSESRSSALNRMISSTLMGGLRTGGDGRSGSSNFRSSNAFSFVSTRAPYKPACASAGIVPSTKSEKVVCSLLASRSVKPVGMINPTRA